MSLGQYKQQLVQTTYKSTEGLLFACLDLHRFLVGQIQQTQHMVVEYLQLKPAYRTPFYNRYLMFVHDRLKDSYEHAASSSAALLETAYAHIQQMNIASQEVATIFGSMIVKLKSDENLLKQARSYMTGDWVNYEGPTPKVFSSVPSASYHRRHKTLEKLVFRDLKHMPTGVRQVADQCFKLLQIEIPYEKVDLDPGLVTDLESKLQEIQKEQPPVPSNTWLTLDNRPKPTTVTNMGSTTLPTLNSQLYSALQVQPNPQPQLASTSCESIHLNLLGHPSDTSSTHAHPHRPMPPKRQLW